MPRSPRRFACNKPALITAHTQRGLPFVATLFLNTILYDILARAHSAYKVRICHFIWSANFVKLIVVVDDPKAIPGFMRYLKAESSHAMGKLLGESQRGLWRERYEASVVLSADEVIQCTAQLYVHPTQTNLVETIDDFPGVCSWEMYRSGNYRKNVRRIRRPSILELPAHPLSLAQQQVFANQLLTDSTEEYELSIEPNAWLKCFQESRRWSFEYVNEVIVKKVRALEARLGAERSAPVVGRYQLRLEDIRGAYNPRHIKN